jgi:hypothetical protein
LQKTSINRYAAEKTYHENDVNVNMYRDFPLLKSQGIFAKTEGRGYNLREIVRYKMILFYC